MTVKTILTEPNKILRQVSLPVEKIGREEQVLMDDMLETMYMAKGIGGKKGMFRGKEMRPPTIKMDQDFYTSGRNEEVMKKALQAKFTQDELDSLTDLKQYSVEKFL